MFVYVYVWRYPGICKHCMGRSPEVVFLITLYFISLCQGFSMDLDFKDWLGWLTTELRGTTYLCPLCLVLT